MKSPRAPRPSGDRRIARLFMSALNQADFTVELASELRSWEGNGDPLVQDQIRREGEAEADRLIADYLARPAKERPRIWLTYHLYHKAPDWVGPAVADATGMSYVIAEASVAERQRHGPWREGHQQVLRALSSARLALTINPVDAEGISPWLAHPSRVLPMLPFLATPETDNQSRHTRKQRLGAKLKIDPDRYWLLCVAMMRDDAKFESYRILANTLERVERSDWSLLVVGDGAAQARVRELFRYDNARQIYFLGRRDEPAVNALMAACDLLVWPAVNEAIGMVALEAMANGLPVAWGKNGGIETIVEHGSTGLLVNGANDEESAQRLAIAIEKLLDDPATLAAMSDTARRRFTERHDLMHAASMLKNALVPLLKDGSG